MEKTFGQKIRDYRIENTHLSLRKLAETVDISPTYLSRIENDKEPPPSEDIIIRIAQTLGVDEDELLSYADKISPDLYKTILEKPNLFPNFISTVRNFDQTRLEDIIKLVQFIQSKSLRMKRKEWNYVEKIIKDLLGEKLNREELENIYNYVHTEIKTPK
jgi:transcriptional regulator with XRE-family HTH domain